MDNSLNKLESWLWFEFMCTVGALLLVLDTFFNSDVQGSARDTMEPWLLFGGFLLALRAVLLIRACIFLDDNATVARAKKKAEAKAKKKAKAEAKAEAKASKAVDEAKAKKKAKDAGLDDFEVYDKD